MLEYRGRSAENFRLELLFDGKPGLRLHSVLHNTFNYIIRKKIGFSFFGRVSPPPTLLSLTFPKETILPGGIQEMGGRNLGTACSGGKADHEGEMRQELETPSEPIWG